MTYEAYESRMLKIAKVLDKIRKYRVLIISVLAAVLVAISTLVGIKGMIIEDAAAPSSPFVYGDSFEFSAKALFGEASFEYTLKGEDDWSSEPPILPGVYSVRAVSRRAFGIKSYGKIFSLEILPLEIVVNVSGSAVYGESPNLEGDFIRGDKVEGFEYEYEDPYAKTTAVTVNSNSLKISSSAGADVSSAYKVTVLTTEVTFTKRPITVTFYDSSKVYDGKTFSSESYQLSAEIAKGDTLLFAPEQFISITDVGECDNINRTFSILNSNGKDMSDMYEITLVPGRLEILPREIKITTESSEKVYDGTPLINTAYKIPDGFSIAEGQSATILSSSSITDVGAVENKIVLGIIDATGKDVTKNYIITAENGNLTVTKRPISFVAQNGSWEYDGTEHTGSQLEVAFTIADAASLVDTQVVKDLVTDGKITFVGECENKITSLEIYTADGTRVTENYELSFTSGKLSVTPRKITVTTPDISKTYDAKPLGGEKTPDGKANYSLSATLGKGDKLSGDFATITNVLETKKGNNVVTFKVMRSGEDVSENYAFTYKYGTLTVNPRPITVGAVDFSWEYDGTEHGAKDIKNNIAIVDGKLVSGHKASATTVGKVTDANDSEGDIKAVHSVDVCTVTDKDGNDVTSNYKITKKNGELTVTKRPIRVNLADGSWYYDGAAHTPTEIKDRFTLDYLGTAGTGALVLDHIMKISSTGSVTEVPDISAHGYSSFKIVDAKNVDKTSNYSVSVVEGELKIEKRPITVTLSDAQWVYDGKEHSVREISALFKAELNLDIDAPALVLDHVFTPDTYGSITNKGSVEHSINSWTLTDASGADKSYNYDVTVVTGTLTVTPRPITISTATKTAVYDASVVMIEEATILAGTLAEGQKISYSDFATIINVGAVENSVTVVITDASDIPTTDNYDITYELGTITVTQRPVEITADDGVWIYDGVSHSGNELAPGYTVTGQTPIVSGQTAVIETEGSIINVGTVESVIKTVTIYATDGADVTANYKITSVNGILTVNQRPITVITESLEKEYDADVLKAEESDVNVYYGVPGDIRIDMDGIVSVDEISEYNFISEIINVSESGRDNEVTIKISRNGLDVTSNYSISYYYGTLTITEREITITAVDDSWEYDGAAHGATEITDKVITQNLVEGHTLVPVTSSDTVVNVGDSVNHNVISFTVFDENNVDVTANYAGSYVSGTLTIDPRPISIEMASGQWVYDGQTHYGYDLENPFTATYAGSKENQSALIEGHTIFVTSVGSITDVGTEAHEQGTVLITDTAGADVTANYTVVSTTDGVLEVVPRELTVTTGSASKVYDDTPLKAESYEITYGTVIDNYEVIVDYVTSLTNVGVVDNEIDFVICDTYGYDVTFNYDITFVYGTLEVTKRNIEISPKSESFIYDGILHTPTDYVVTEDEMLISTHTVDAVYSGEIINVGSVNTEITSATIYSGGIDVTENYEISFAEGTLTVTARPITVITDDVTEIYNGSYITGDENGVTVVYGTPDALDYEIVAIPSVDVESFLFGNGIINVADSGAENTVVLTLSRDGEDVSDNYDISYVYGTITVLLRDITVTTGDYEWEYDGELHNAAEILDKFTHEGAVEGHTVTVVTESESIRNVIDSAEHKIVSVVITDDQGVDVSANYRLSKVEGMLTVSARKIGITLGSYEWVYDGQLHTAYELDPRYTIEYLGSTEGVLAIIDGHVVEITSLGEIKNKGTVDHSMGAIVIRDSEGEDVSANYEVVETVDGVLTVIPRSITVTTGSRTDIYNGSEIYEHTYEITAGEIVSTHRAEVLYLVSLINVGKEDNEIELTIFDENDEDVTENYDITFELGEIEVTKRPINLAPKTENFIYDGLNHTASDYVLLDDTTLVDGHKVYATYDGSIIDVGTVTVTVKRALIYNGSENVSANYEITCTESSITVDPRPITVITDDITAEYNGKHIKGDESSVTVIYGLPDALDESLVAIVGTDVANYLFGDGIINVSDSGAENSVTLTISRGDDDVSKNYSISYVFGTITITKLDLEVSANNAEIEYDGKWHSAEELDSADRFYIATALPDGHYLDGTTYSEMIKNVGSVLHSIEEVFVYDADGNNVTDNYNLIELDESAYINVTKRVITAVSESYSKEYDGNPVSHSGATVNGLVENHTFSANYDVSSFADVANYDNTFIIYEILDENGEDVKENYQIEYEYGTLSITPRKITITTADDSKIYDATPIRKDEYRITSGSLVVGQIMNVEFITELINVGYDDNEIKVTIMSGDADVTKNYEIEYLLGTLTVEKRPITLQTGSGEWVYSGEYISGEDLTDAYTVLGEYGIVDGQHVVITWNSYIDAGEYSSDYSSIDIVDSNGDSVFTNYGVSVSLGTLIIKPRPITVITDDITEIYTGSSIGPGADDVHIYYGTPDLLDDSKAAVVGDDIYELVFADGIVNVADSGALNEVTILLKRADKDVSENYEISYVYGIITIDVRDITVDLVDGIGIYDGKFHNASEIVEKLRLVAGTLPEGHKLYADSFSEDIIDVGFVEHVLVKAFVLDADDRDVSANYNITVGKDVAKIEIVPRDVLISSDSETKIYDAEPLVKESITASGLCEGHTVNVVYLSSITNAGEIINDFEFVSITDADGNDVTTNYNPDFDYGMLTVTRRPIIIVTENRDKIYDGTLLLGDESDVTVVYGIKNAPDYNKAGLVADHTLALSFEGIIDAAMAQNIAVVEDILSASGSVKDNYLISYSYGNLEVKPRPITVITDDRYKEYDGTELKGDEDGTIIIYGTPDDQNGELAAIIDGETVTYDFLGIVNVKDSGPETNSVIISVFKDGENWSSNYSISYVYGELTVTPRVITLRPNDLVFYYDGEEHSATDYEDNMTVTAGSLVFGHMAHSISSEKIKEIGTLVYNVTEVEIISGKKEFTENYEIHLEITFANMTVVEDDGTGENPETPGDGTGGGTGGGSGDGTGDGTGSGTGGGSIGGIKIDLLNPPASDGEDGGDGEPADKIYLFEILASYTGNLLLYNKHYGDYLGTSWADAPAGEDIESLFLMTYALMNSGENSESVEIKILQDIGYLLPYYATAHEFDDSIIEYVLSIYRYSLTADGQLPTLSDEWKSFEEEYREFAYSNYTNLPISTRRTLRTVLAEECPNYTSMSRLELVLWIENYVKNVAPYDLTFEVPEGTEDVAVWFLTDPDASGICSHFATAATALYRAAGIPARIISGVSAPVRNGEWISVGSGNAHAWVEVYFDGIGWITVDPTGSESGSNEGPGTPGDPGTPDDPSTEIVEIEVKTGSSDKIYDGLNFVLNQYEITEGQLKSNHQMIVYFDDTVKILPGIYSNDATVIIIDENGNDVSDEYDVTVISGTLSINGIVLAPYNVRYAYDGNTHYYTDVYPDIYSRVNIISGWEILPAGYKISAVVIGYGTEVGDTMQSYIRSYVIYDENDNDITEQYSQIISLEKAEFRIISNNIEITTGSITENYTGSAIRHDEYTITGGELAEGHSLSVEFYDADLILPGTYYNMIAGVTILDENGIDVTHEYSITTVEGEITILGIVLSPYEIYIAYDGKTWTYDMKYADPFDRVWIVDGESILPEGYRISAVVSASATTPMDTEAEEGTDKGYSVITDFVIYDGDGNDVTDIYRPAISLRRATFKILKINLSITTGSAERKYTATKLTNNTYSITTGTLWNGHTISVTFTAKAINKGMYDNTVDVVIIDSEKNDVTGYYEIEYNLGKLVIN